MTKYLDNEGTVKLVQIKTIKKYLFYTEIV